VQIWGYETWKARKTPRMPAIAAGIFAPLTADSAVIPATRRYDTQPVVAYHVSTQ